MKAALEKTISDLQRKVAYLQEQIQDLHNDDSKERALKDRIAQLEQDLHLSWKVITFNPSLINVF